MIKILKTVCACVAYAVIAAILLLLSFNNTTYSRTHTETVRWDDALDQKPAWYGSSEAIRIADNVLLYQHESGGWPKNLDMVRKLSASDKDSILTEQTAGGTTLSNITIDNGATYKQMQYLARVYNATGKERFRQSFLKGVDYLLEAQYANGGWPQYYPIREGYYEKITFNDGAMIGALNILQDVAGGQDRYSFVDVSRREHAKKAVKKGVDAILKMQITRNDKLMGWCAQYDEETLEPAWARSYEPPSIGGAISVGVTRFLMSIEAPTEEIIVAVDGAVQWFKCAAIYGYRFEEFEDEEGNEDKRIVRDPDGPPLWARFYEIETNRPIFMNRDSEIYYKLSKIPQERRGGYDWYGDWAEELLTEDYPEWRTRHNLSRH